MLHIEIQDLNGGLWKLATQDASWSPTEPSQLIDREVRSAELNEETGELRLALSDGSSFSVVPAEQEAEDDPPNWKLFTPNGLVLVFGPGGRWQFNRADEPLAFPLGSEALPSGLISKSRALAMMTLADEEWKFRKEEWASELLLKERAVRNEQLMLSLAVGISIVSIAVAAVSLVFALQ
ncbi:MAG TPA: hypothetical protein VFT79_09770 [Solirubrobacterales bacterium]|nr:hypothetical protein [Solirubrobacterales bacterium]